jgi:hypothetical protein
MFGPFGRLAERSIGGEIRRWNGDNPGAEHWLIRPNHAVAALARMPQQLFNPDRAGACYHVAYEQGTELCRERFHT